eukprot:CAMPEP_0206186014 /NCGR_PEP_ID=MMETSP0166-20121206/2160_1 /ASSEMBLY_ACC=CAM_ASM_000260 /TAXON_ID=95228 /ORGANISM="Vannella robusta, Strain DIVA3 518/3/11/1/6" /LENGTH=251 /DNA_ID=CAMNT_0053601337 /DNA_START=48 /DNA_END=803 /DNA_ORIENTATION=-
MGGRFGSLYYMGFFDSIVSSVQEAVDDVSDPGTSAELQQVFENLGADKVIAGIKEALAVAISEAIEITGKTDGFLANELIKIGMPAQVRPFTDSMRAAGFGGLVDEFELSMNRAAEESAPLARDVFVTTIRNMTVEDAEKIWRGTDKQAATSYLNRNCSEQLTTSFAPKVTEAMSRNQVTKVFCDLVDKVEGIPLVAGILKGVDLESYTVQQALEGLFKVMGEQEARIREDPAGTSSQLLHSVFSRQAFKE